MASPFAKLTLISSEGQEEVFPLDKAEVTLGSAETNDVVLRRLGVARAHARIDCDSVGCTLIDLGAPKGCLVNDQPVERYLLATNDVITLGNALLRFESLQPASAETVPTDIDEDAATVMAAPDATVFVPPRATVEATAEPKDTTVALRDEGFDTSATEPAFEMLVPLQTQGDNRPFFCVVPGYCDVPLLETLAQHIGSDQPFYALRPPKFGSNAKLLADVATLAGYYMSQIATVHPDGPYTLGGYGIGGLVAFDVARQLIEKGQRITRLILLDTPFSIINSQLYANYRLAQTIDRAAPVVTQQIQEFFAHGPVKQFFDQVQQTVSQATSNAPNIPFQKVDVPDIRSDIATLQTKLKDQGLETTLRLTQNYVPQPVQVRVTLFLAQHSLVKDLGTLGYWSTVALDGVSDHFTLGNHDTMLQAPNVSMLSEQLRPHLGQ